jgi:hypothetical protein
MNKNTRKDCDAILGPNPQKEEGVELSKAIFFDLKKLLKSALCILLIIAVFVMFLMNYFPKQEVLLADIFGKYLPSLILSIIILIFFAKPVFIFIFSFIDDEWGIFLVPLILIIFLPLILIILFIYSIVSIIKNCLRPKL